MVVVAAAALVFAAARLDDDPLHLALFLLINSLSVYLAIRGARRTGRHWSIALLLVLLLGPIGAFFAWTDRLPGSSSLVGSAVRTSSIEASI
jgi:hypothetical protein